MKLGRGTIKRRSSGITSLSKARGRLHLRPNSTVHKQDRDYALLERKRTENWDSVPIHLYKRLKFKSLKLGVCLRPDGSEFSDEGFDRYMTELVRSRSRYKRETYDARDGRARTRWQIHKEPVIQIPVTFRPDHAAALSKLDQNNFLVRGQIKKLATYLGQCFREMSGYDVQGIAVHPESGNLHCHIIFSVVSADGTLLHARGQRGRHGMRSAGMGLIGSLRLAEQGILPADYVQQLQGYLESRYTPHSQPYDYLLSEQLDAAVECWVLQEERRGVGGQSLGEIFAEERETWCETVKKRLDEKLVPKNDQRDALLRELLEAIEVEEKSAEKAKAQPMANAYSPSVTPPAGSRLSEVLAKIRRYLASETKPLATQVTQARDR